MNSLRPEKLDEFVGQEPARRILSVLISASKKRNEPVPHLLMSGSAGLGKTSLARIVAHEMNGRLVEMVGGAVKNTHDMTNHLLQLRANDVLFIDEIHALPRKIEEVLYGAMEDSTITVEQRGFNDLMRQIGVQPGEKSRTAHQLSAFTLIGATTMAGLCSAPLRSRFRQVLEMQPYSEDELLTIARSAGAKLGFDMDPGIALEIAKRSRGTARIAINNTLWYRDVVMGDGEVATMELLKVAFEMKGIDENGLTKSDREYLRLLIGSEEAVGAETLATALDESVETVQQGIEPFLIRQGFVTRTPRGRVATEKARVLFQQEVQA